MTRDDLIDFVAAATPGATLVYHQGELTRDRLRVMNLDEVAGTALELAGYRKCGDELKFVKDQPDYLLLLQRRIKDVTGASTYIAIRNSRPFERTSVSSPHADVPEPEPPQTPSGSGSTLIEGEAHQAPHFEAALRSLADR